MITHMNAITVRKRELFLTIFDFALIRFFACMDAHMFLAITMRDKTLLAKVTFKRFDTRMNFHVIRKQSLVTEDFVAFNAAL